MGQDRSINCAAVHEERSVRWTLHFRVRCRCWWSFEDSDGVTASMTRHFDELIVCRRPDCLQYVNSTSAKLRQRVNVNGAAEA